MLKFLILIPPLIFGTSKVLIQGKLTRTILNNSTDFTLYNSIVFFFIGLIFFVQNGVSGLERAIVPYIVGYAFFNSVFQYAYTTAMKNGPIAISALMVNLSSGLVVVFGIFRYGDIPSTLNLFGFVFLVASLLMSADFKSAFKEKMSARWLIASLSSALLNAATTIIYTDYGKTFGQEKNMVLISLGNVCACVIAFFFFLLSDRREKHTLQLNLKNVLCIFSVAAALAIYQPFMLRGVKIFSSAVYFPLMNTATICIISLLSFTLFRDKLKKNQICGLISGIIAIVLLSV